MAGLDSSIKSLIAASHGAAAGVVRSECGASARGGGGPVAAQPRTEEYVPFYSARRRLFPGFVFCRFDYHRRLPVLITPGVTSIVGFGGDPVPVSESEIDDIKTILASGLPAQPWPFIRVGQPVRIECGSLAGLEGILLREKDTLRVVVQHRAAPPLRRRRDRSRRPVWPSTAQRMPKGPACISRLDFCVC
jgi:transcription antitermination factor NusG